MITRVEVAEILAAAEEATMATSSGGSTKTTVTMTGATATALEAIEGATTTEGEGEGSSLSPGEDQIGAIKDDEVPISQLCLTLDPHGWTPVCHCVRRRRQSAQLIYLRLLAAPPRGRGRDAQAGRQQSSRYDRPPQQRFDDQAKDVEFVGPALKGHESRITALLYDAASQQVSSCPVNQASASVMPRRGLCCSDEDPCLQCHLLQSPAPSKQSASIMGK